MVGDTASFVLGAQDGSVALGALVVLADAAPWIWWPRRAVPCWKALVVLADVAPFELVAQEGTTTTGAAVQFGRLIRTRQRE